MRWHFVTLLVFTVFASPVTSAPLEIKTINEAQLHGPMPPKEQINPILTPQPITPAPSTPAPSTSGTQ
jgi:hypothetical protein